MINLLLILLNWQWPNAKIWFVYACHQLKRVLFVVNEVYPRNAEPLPFRFVNRYNAPFIFQFALERFEPPRTFQTFKVSFWGHYDFSFPKSERKVIGCDLDHNDLQRDRNRRRTKNAPVQNKLGTILILPVILSILSLLGRINYPWESAEFLCIIIDLFFFSF